MMQILCFDIASGGITAAILDSQLRLVRSAEAPWNLGAGEDGTAALSVADIIGRFKAAIVQLQLSAADRIDAICIDSFMHNCVLLDEADQPLTPVFTWLDHRGADGGALLRSEFGDRFHQMTGCRFHPMFPVFKLASMRIAKNPLLSKVQRIVSIKTLLVQRLTGTWLEDHGIASSSGLFNVQQRCWDPEILECLGLNEGFLPQVASPNEIAGRVHSDAAREFGLAPDTPVVNGTGDGFAAHIGSGCEKSDRISVTLGTSAVVRQMLARPVLDNTAGTFCYAADNNEWLSGCAGSNGGNVLDWGRAVLGAPSGANAAADLPIFIPLLNGERSPEWDPGLTGSWYGLTARHTASDLGRSILEGVVFNLAHYLEIVQTASGVRAASVVLSGNGFLYPLAAALLSSVADVSIGMPDQPGTMTLRGAAIRALQSFGESVPALSCRPVTPLDDSKILRRYVEYRRIRGTLARAT